METGQGGGSRAVRVACIGEAMLELAPEQNGTYRLGVAGDTFNTAVYLRRLLGPEHEVSYVTAVGDDDASSAIPAALAAEGLSTDHVEIRPGRTSGLYLISVTPKGERSFAYWRGQSAARTLFSPPWDAAMAKLAAFDMIYFSAITLAILPTEVRERLMSWLDGCRAKGGQVAFDSNYRRRLWESEGVARAAITSAWSRTDIALPSLDDEMALFGESGEPQVLGRLRALGVTRGALKRGEAGPVAIEGGVALPAFRPAERIVDTTAAGDSFNAGYLAAIIGGEEASVALWRGHALASVVVGHRGAIIPKDAMPALKV